jgi:RNA polymerase sigma-70 factor (ECF subfamily)
MSWDSREEIRRAVFGEIESKVFGASFERLRTSAPALKGFASPADLRAFLRAPDPARFEEKDAALHALVCAAQAGGRLAGAAKTLLFAAMWPALEHSLLRLFSILSGTEDPFAEVYWAFLEEVRLWNPDKRDRVAANLQRNTEKRVRRAVGRECRHRAFRLEAMEAVQGLGPGGLRAVAESERGEVRTEADRTEAEAFLGGLVDRELITLEERLLLIGHALYGRTLKDLAVEHGISHDAARKRYQRAMKRVCEALGRPEFFSRKACPTGGKRRRLSCGSREGSPADSREPEGRRNDGQIGGRPGAR